MPAYVEGVRKIAVTLALLGAGMGLAGCARSDATRGVAVVATEMKFGPDTISVPAGRQKFTVVNEGKLRHTFSLNELGQEVTVAAGQTKTLSIDLKPGTYRYVCRVLDHEGLGMRGVMKVRAEQ